MILWGGGIEPQVNDAITIASCASKASSAYVGKHFIITIYTYYPDFSGVRAFDLDTGLEIIFKKMVCSGFDKKGKKGYLVTIAAEIKGTKHYRFYGIDSLGQISKEYKELTLTVK